jgi:N-acetyl-anhydromuramyl-L-alanine amidase AmpD
MENIMELTIRDVRAEMPNYENYKDWERNGAILGIAVHHSATADNITGAPTGNAHSYFDYHVNTRGWAHGGYNYVIVGNGDIEYALDEKISAYHAGFKDPDDSEGLEFGQYWNNHYVAICLSGWFSENRTYRDAEGRLQPIPNQHTSPSEAQLESLVGLIQQLRLKYDLQIENIRGHRELAGSGTICPGQTFDPAELRERIRMSEQGEPEPWPGPDQLPQVEPGEHVILLTDSDRYFDSAMAYIWKFRPDVSFAVNEASGRWKYVTAVGTKEDITDTQLDRLRTGGAVLVQRIEGDPTVVQSILDELVESNLRFLTTPAEPPPEPAPSPEPEPPPAADKTYTVQPGDSLSSIARQVYGQSHLWRIIFEANRHILSDPALIRPGQMLTIPPKPE